jgi:hypothetical protein
VTFLAITRGGFGEIYQFATRADAFLHPIVQYGDAILGSADDLVDNYNRLEWSNIAALAGLVLDAQTVATLVGENHIAAARVRRSQASNIWEHLVNHAQLPPTDPQRICDIVLRDRRLGVIPVSKKLKAETAAPDVANAAENHDSVAASPKEKAPKEPTGPKAPKGTELTSVIRFNNDKEGKPFGPDNNPKRAGTAGHSRFALYTDGMTVEAAMAAGIWGADIKWDMDKGFIRIEGGVAAAPAPTEETEGGDPVAAEAA